MAYFSNSGGSIEIRTLDNTININARTDNGTTVIDPSYITGAIDKRITSNTNRIVALEETSENHEERIDDLENTSTNHETRISDLENSGAVDKTFVYEQNTPSDTWVITHNLGKRPSVEVVDSAGTKFFPEVQWVNDNMCIIYFNVAFSGKAYLN